MPATGRRVGAAGALGEGATLLAAPGAVAVLPAAGAALPVTGVDASDVVPDAVPADDAVAPEAVAAGLAGAEPAVAVDPARDDCCAVGALAELADTAGCAAAVVGVTDAGAAAVTAGAAAELCTAGALAP
jgi:hypothetical protein